MARINNTTTFPITTPATDDLVIGTDVSDTTNSADGESVNFKLQDILAISPTATEFVEVYEPDNTVSEVDFALPSASTFGSVVFEFAGVRHGSGTDRQLTIRFSTDGGSTYIDTDGNYATIGAIDQGDDSSAIFLSEKIDNTSGTGINGEVRVHGFGRSDVRCCVTSNLICESGTAGNLSQTSAGGHLTADTVVTNVRFRLGGINFRDGHIIVRANKIV